MLRKAQLMEIVSDTRLSPDAVRLVLAVALRGDGEHEIDMLEFRVLLNQAGERRVRDALGIAQRVGWISRRPGGRGHPDRFAFSPANPASLSTDSPAHTADLNTPDNAFSPAQSATLTDSPAQNAGLSAASHTCEHGVGLRDGDEVGGEPPVVPLFGTTENPGPGRVSDRALAAIESAGEQLQGCRGALKDYLSQRVLEARQYGYVQSLVGWRNGTEDVFRRSDGSRIPHEKHTQLIAAALNDLAQDDERRMARPVGDIGNLRTKLSILINPRNFHERNGKGRAHGGAAPGEAAREASRTRTPGGEQASRRRRGFGT